MSHTNYGFFMDIRNGLTVYRQQKKGTANIKIYLEWVYIPHTKVITDITGRNISTYI